MYKIMLADDEGIVIDSLTYIIRQNFDGECQVESAKTGRSVIELAEGYRPDIAFMDIQMPGINGIYVGNELKRANDNIIIFVVTSYSQYLDDAMRFHVFRYLSKPLDIHRFFRNMKDAIDLYTTMAINLPIETKQGVHTLPASSVIAVEAQGRKVTVHTTLCDFESVHNMQYWLELLPKNLFFQTHRSFIINFEHVTNFDRNLIYMTAGLSAYLTKRKYSLFKEAYLLYLESTR